MNKLVLLKLDPTFACMPDTCNADVLRNAMKTACPIWQCRLECIRGGCMTVMVSRNPMTGEICAVEHDSGRGMMVRLLRRREVWTVLTIAAYIAGRWWGAHVRHADDDDPDAFQDVGSLRFRGGFSSPRMDAVRSVC